MRGTRRLARRLRSSTFTARAKSTRNIRPRIREVRSRLFYAALAAGLLVRLATIPLPGNDDVIVWKLWSYAGTNDLTGMYGVGGTPTTRGVVAWGEHSGTVEYPPVFLYEYAIVGHAYRALFPDYPDGLA